MSQLYHCDTKLLANAIRRYPMPPEAKTDITKLKPSKSVKEVHKTYPDRKTQEEMRDVEQNSQRWLDLRRWGASENAPLAGFDHYSSTNVTVWLQHTGRVSKQPPRIYDSQLPLDFGHWNEDEPADIYRIAMGCHVFTLGLLLHSKIPKQHISPDRVVEFPPDICHNIYTQKDSKRILLEIKNPLFVLYETKSGQRANVPSGYALQLHVQSDTFQVQCVDFMCHLRCRQDNPKSQPIPEIDKETGDFTGRFLCAESLITRVYRNNEGAKRVYELIDQHTEAMNADDFFIDFVPDHTDYAIPKPNAKQDVWLYFVFSVVADAVGKEFSNDDYEPETDEAISAMVEKKRIDLDGYVYKFEDDEFSVIYGETEAKIHLTLNEEHQTLFADPRIKVTLITMYPPKLVHKAPFPDLTIVPLKRIKFFITPPKGKMSCVDPDTLHLVGEIEPEIENFWDHKPLRVSMNACDEASDECEELDRVPFPEPQYTYDQVQNPLLKELWDLDRDKKLSDVIWDFITNTPTVPKAKVVQETRTTKRKRVSKKPQ